MACESKINTIYHDRKRTSSLKKKKAGPPHYYNRLRRVETLLAMVAGQIGFPWICGIALRHISYRTAPVFPVVTFSCKLPIKQEAELARRRKCPSMHQNIEVNVIIIKTSRLVASRLVKCIPGPPRPITTL
ncbi:hypothetical protein L211DRAFT_367085 [Terfezia boudieri ATCC MYA-4762]|uniref:Uncharacterized protein n=1 Tax=Terfezia boudieri ATCC MYA-4762 TaxID=1051890 RepID=A0A3N4LZ87_9PEZI|nr:hypothetical protein L211DRAFT_367085 [Terfezia boudieri ATCC MYA-4762]